MSMTARILYAEICAWLRCNMPLRGPSTEPLRKAETRIFGVISIDTQSGCSDEAISRSAWSFARRYVDEAQTTEPVEGV